MSIALRQAVASSLKAAVFASASAVGFSGVALAQEGAPATLEEVLVTATRSASETDLQTTPVSVTAVTATQIDQFVAK
ncbi:MAG: hypothetical protein ACO39S_10110, partial [Steroidobacteraceae bacterium]